MFTRIIVAWVIICALAGCDGGQIDGIDLDYVGDQLTLVGYISPTEIRIRAGKTVPADVSFYAPESYAPTDMVLEILDAKDSLIHRLPLTQRRYFISKDIRLNAGTAYRVRATAAGFPTATSNLLTIPEPVTDMDIQDIKPIDDLGVSGAIAGQLDFSFTDRDPARNFYYSNIGLKKDSLTYSPLVWMINEQWQSQCYNDGVFSDDCFNQRKVALQYGFQTLISSLKGSPAADTMLFRFGPNTPELYHYYQSNIIKNDGLIDGVNEPPVTYTNLIDGYGVVFAQNWREYKVALR